MDRASGYIGPKLGGWPGLSEEDRLALMADLDERHEELNAALAELDQRVSRTLDSWNRNVRGLGECCREKGGPEREESPDRHATSADSTVIRPLTASPGVRTY